MKKAVRMVAYVALSCLLTGCASIIGRTYQTIAISSYPTGCRVSVDGIEIGKAPISVDLRRRGPLNAERRDRRVPLEDTHRARSRPKEVNHVVRLELDGYETFEMMLTRKLNGWVWGNLAFGWFIGLIVDAGTGALYKIEPESVMATLAKSGNGEHADMSQDAARYSTEHKDGVLHVVVTLLPDPGLQQVGLLSRRGSSSGR